VGTTHLEDLKVYPNQLIMKRLRRVEKLLDPKSQPILSEASQTEWCKPFDFAVEFLTGFPVDPYVQSK